MLLGFFILMTKNTTAIFRKISPFQAFFCRECLAHQFPDKHFPLWKNMDTPILLIHNLISIERFDITLTIWTANPMNLIITIQIWNIGIENLDPLPFSYQRYSRLILCSSFYHIWNVRKCGKFQDCKLSALSIVRNIQYIVLLCL